MIKRNRKPGLINIDKSGANKAAIKDYNKENGTRIKIRQCKYLNNVAEQDHRFVKRKMRQAMGFENHRTASKTIEEIELWRMLKKAQMKWGGTKSSTEYFYGLAT